MKASRLRQSASWIGLVLSAWVGLAHGQTFSSGSTGADGAYAPSCSPTPCTVTQALPPDGVFNYTTVTIPSGVTVRYTRNAANTPVTILATGDVTINGTINLNGSPGADGSQSSNVVRLGGLGGPGGFNGGNGSLAGGVLTGTAGQGPSGGTTPGGYGQYGAPTTFVALIPLFGGSGGAGIGGVGSGSGASGGGGGGAVVIASSTKITVAGSVVANGAAGGDVNGGAGVGSGGAIRLVAPQIAGAGTLQALGPVGNHGRIRLEAFTLPHSGPVSPQASYSVVPGPITASSNPALANLPTLAIASVDGVSAPAVPGGSYSAADVSLPQGTANPVTVTIAATNTPVPATITLRLMPQTANPTTINVAAGNHTGTFASSSATASVTFPAGQVSLIQAWASYTLTGQIASLMPLIDGEPVERVMVASADGKSSILNLVTTSGKEKRLDQLPAADQLKVAQAWQLLAVRAE